MDPAKKMDLFSRPEPFSGFDLHQQAMPQLPQMPQLAHMDPRADYFSQKPTTPGYGHQSYSEGWMQQQREQASKMFDDQQKMIVLYQQALE